MRLEGWEVRGVRWRGTGGGRRWEVEVGSAGLEWAERSGVGPRAKERGDEAMHQGQCPEVSQAPAVFVGPPTDPQEPKIMPTKYMNRIPTKIIPKAKKP